jgi:hypothetical protein
MLDQKELEPGTRVRLRSPHHLLQLRSDTGRVLRPDEHLDYYIVRLDAPALYFHADGQAEELSEVREDADNLDVLPD